MLSYLQSIWCGPAVRIVIPGYSSFVAGHGSARVTITINRPVLLWRLLFRPSLTFGEGYMRGEIRVEGHLMDVLEGFYKTSESLRGTWIDTLSRLFRKHHREAITTEKATQNARHHYDIGNDFYKLWLDESLTYSCAYFLRDDDTLAVAQQQKIDLVLRKIRLQPGQRLLDIGCGWGSLLLRAAEAYGADVYGVTPAAEQADHIEAEARRQGIAGQVHVTRGDWRTLTGTYDRIVSIGMFEHVGQQQYAAFFARWQQLLAQGGISLLHTIGRMHPSRPNPWIRRYIFPGGYLPTVAELAHHAAATNLVVADVENLWQHYEKTLTHWQDAFEYNHHKIVALFDEQFVRMWQLYLAGSISGFRWGGLHLWQMVLLKDKQATWPLDREVHLSYHKPPDTIFSP